MEPHRRTLLSHSHSLTLSLAHAQEYVDERAGEKPKEVKQIIEKERERVLLPWKVQVACARKLIDALECSSVAESS